MESHQSDYIQYYSQWPYRKRLTCSIWALGQRILYGGNAKFVRSPHVWWLFRVLWSPDGKTWFGYIPLEPKKPGIDPWWQVLWHSLWFEGRVRQEKRHDGKTPSSARY